MKGLSYKWIVASVVIFGVFMVMLDTTIVNIAIPRLQNAFGAGLTDVSWVATGYTLAEGAGIPLTPFFSALLGNKRFYLLILAQKYQDTAWLGSLRPGLEPDGADCLSYLTGDSRGQHDPNVDYPALF